MAVFSKVLGSAISLAYVVSALNNGLAVTPQMGWNDWNAFQCNLDEQLILATADVIKNTGLRDLGYHYVILDDCWSSGRSSSGQLVADAKKFPNGMKYVGDQLHASGFGFGMYSSAGTKTCAGYPASLGRETTDANTFASWGVDYLKYDNCNNQGESGSQAVSSARYDAMEKALAATGRKILYSLCNWGEDSPWIWGPSVGNSWRITGDITDRFNTQSSTCPVPNSGGYGCSVTQILSKQAQIASYAGPGGWNDLDMLEVGNGGMTDDEYVAHFSMWSAAKSPLIMGNDMRKLKASDWSILANAAVIAVNQDPLGKAALYRWTHNNVQLWSGPLASTTGSSVDDMVVVLYNNGGSSTTASASLADIFGSSNVPNTKFEIRDLWGSRLSSSQAQAVLTDGAAAHSSWLYNASQQSYKTGLDKADSKLLGTAVGSVSGATGSISQSVPALGCRMFRLRAVGDSTPGQGSSSTTTAKTTTTTTQAGTTTTAGGQGPQQTQYGQCGGQGWTGPTACVPPATCHSQNQWYSQCL